MKVVYEHKRAMTLIGFSKRIRQSEGYVQCPAFWADYARRYKRLWQGAEPENGAGESRARQRNRSVRAVRDG